MKWKYIKRDRIWKKQLHHYWITITDAWGVRSNSKYNYKIDTFLYRCFSIKHGFWYQINVPNFTANDKTIGGVLDMLFAYLYRDGGTPCYQRLKDELIDKGLWKELG